MFNIVRTTLEIDERKPNDITYHIRHYNSKNECVAEQFLTENQAVQAQENNPAIKVVYIKEQ